jgi:hypothetical protein
MRFRLELAEPLLDVPLCRGHCHAAVAIAAGAFFRDAVAAGAAHAATSPFQLSYVSVFNTATDPIAMPMPKWFSCRKYWKIDGKALFSAAPFFGSENRRTGFPTSA